MSFDSQFRAGPNKFRRSIAWRARVQLDYNSYLWGILHSPGARQSRASKRAIVVRFSGSRGRYPRQGTLVETSALEKAEQESVDDADERVASRVRDAERRREHGRTLVAQMTKQIGLLFPGCPDAELSAIAEHTAAIGGADG